MKELELFLNTYMAKSTRGKYEDDIKSFLNYNNIENIEQLKEIDADDCFAWRNYLLESNTPNTIKAKLSSVSSFYNYLMSNPKYGVIMNPIAAGELRKKTKGKTNPENTTWLDKQEATNFMKCCRNARETAMCAVLCNNGLRVSELIGLELESYEKFKNERGEDCAHITIRRKGGKLQVIQFNSYVTEKIDKYLLTRKETDCPKLFVSNAGTPMTTVSIDRTIKKIAKRAGITKKVSAHSLRRTAATNMYRAGFQVKEIQNVLGHQSLGTTDIYLKGLEDCANNVFQNFVIKGE